MPSPRIPDNASPILWIVPERKGGIRTYSDALGPAMGPYVHFVDHLPSPDEVVSAKPSIGHVQHEFGLFGSKLPWRYTFPSWFARARAAAPKVKWVATAHTVIDENWRYRTSGQGWKSLPLAVLNLFAPLFRGAWMEKTWGGFDGVIVHSEHQRAAVLKSGCPRVAVIPHFVPSVDRRPIKEPEEKTVLLFGYFSPEKGQDIAIQAWASLGADAPKLILAGGVRRQEDRAYHAMCVSAIKRLGLESRIEITGFVPEARIADYFAKATLVLAPFRETNGSGSLATALGYGSAILASDLTLNREIDTRVPGSLAFFRSESSDSLADEIRNLFGDTDRRKFLRAGAIRYAEAYSPVKIADLHHAFYREVLGEGKA